MAYGIDCHSCFLTDDYYYALTKVREHHHTTLSVTCGTKRMKNLQHWDNKLVGAGVNPSLSLTCRTTSDLVPISHRIILVYNYSDWKSTKDA